MKSNRKQTSFRCDRRLLEDFQRKLIDEGRGVKGMSPMLEGWITNYVSSGAKSPTLTHQEGDTDAPVDVRAALADALSVIQPALLVRLLRDLTEVAHEAKD